MSIKKFLGLAAVGGALLLASPAQRAEAASLINPGIAAAVQTETHAANTTEVRWGWRRGWHRHHGWRRHWGWRRGWHHRHWRRW